MTQSQESYPYVIVGAGVAAASAVAGIREQDGTGSVVVLGAEPDPPVYRPDLSKTLWLDADASLEDSAMDVTGEGVELHTSSTVVAIDPDGHRVDLADGTRIGFEHLLIATGASPRTGPIAPGPACSRGISRTASRGSSPRRAPASSRAASPEDRSTRTP